jgi:ABC-2 type transport system permease protein
MNDSLFDKLKHFWLSEVRPVLNKEWIHIFNDSTTLRVAIIIPLFQLFIFGFAINNDVRDVPTYIFDQDASNQSREFIKKLQSSTYFKVEKNVHSKKDLVDSLIAGTAQVGVAIPPDFSRQLLAGKQTSVQILIDGSDSSVANQAQGAIQQLGVSYSLERQNFRKQGSLDEGNGLIDLRPRFLFNPNLETPYFIIPALLGIIVFLVTSFLTCLSIVKEKERGTLEQLLVTPLSPLGLMTGKIIPYMCIGLIDFNLSLFFMYVLFQIPVNGNIFLLEFATIVFMFSSLGLSLIISTVADNQAQAAQLTQMALLPSIFLSGYVFPFDSMPFLFKIIGYLLPVTHFVEISRAIILRGSEFHHLIGSFAALFIEGVIIFGISVKIFKKEIG